MPPARITLPVEEGQAWGQVFIPEGKGPFPAVVLLHDHNGLHSIHRAWGERLVSWGYAALLVDSLTPRGLKSGRGLKRYQQAGDGLAALGYLRTINEIDSNRIGVMGWSMGGTSTLRALAATRAAPTASKYFEKAGRFRAGIAYYPRCFDDYFHGPLLILVGDQDAPSFDICSAVAGTGKAGYGPIRFVQYPGTTHAFDYGVSTNSGFYRITYNPEAEQDAIARVKAFLAENL